MEVGLIDKRNASVHFRRCRNCWQSYSIGIDCKNIYQAERKAFKQNRTGIKGVKERDRCKGEIKVYFWNIDAFVNWNHICSTIEYRCG